MSTSQHVSRWIIGKFFSEYTAADKVIVDWVFKIDGNSSKPPIGFGFNANGELIGWRGSDCRRLTLRESIEFYIDAERLEADMDCGCRMDFERWFPMLLKAFPESEPKSERRNMSQNRRQSDAA